MDEGDVQVEEEEDDESASADPNGIIVVGNDPVIFF